MADLWWGGSASLAAPEVARAAAGEDRASLVVDAWGIFVVDPAGGYLGTPAAAPAARSLSAQRVGTRQL